MSAGLGLSIGDIRTGMIYVGNLIEALQESGRASAAYRELSTSFRWGRCKDGDVARFRAQLERHTSSILLQLSAVRTSNTTSIGKEQDAIQELLLEQQPVVARMDSGVAENNQLLSSVAEQQTQIMAALTQSMRQMQGMLQVQQEIPP
ncbi:MAG: hypothetical protein M1838_005163 [Thelocarpon superellum]|nr:MAG: hypothetical protein M1838_005163 [Thelocarpon superellum]